MTDCNGRLFSLMLTLGMLMTVNSSPATAEPQGWTNEAFLSRFTLIGGGFIPQVSTTISLDASDGSAGTEIDVEDLLGLESSAAVPFFLFNWRINPKNRIVAEYFALNRSGEQEIGGEINWGDLSFPVGASVDSSVDLKLGRLGYGYSFINDGRKEIGITAGLHVASLSSRLRGSVEVGNAGGSVESDTAQITLPLPDIGLTGGYAFTEKFSMSLRLLAFYLAVDDFKGYLLAGDLLAVYELFEHVGIGAGYSAFNVDYQNKTNGGQKYEVDYLFHGPKVFATIRF
ncbi:MAG: hypothetical protein LJE91_15165 [Gammaproteobacteria bacterium]|jgi:hypothetical protein|nr:hypothetical protein [Gammaproteobacteria bacterium]